MPATEETRITIRLSAEQRAKLDALAGAAGTTRVAAIRRLIDSADGVGEQDIEPLDIAGVQRLLSEQARRGNVSAAKALLDYQWQFEKEREADEELEHLRVLSKG